MNLSDVMVFHDVERYSHLLNDFKIPLEYSHHFYTNLGATKDIEVELPSALELLGKHIKFIKLSTYKLIIRANCCDTILLSQLGGKLKNESTNVYDFVDLFSVPNVDGISAKWIIYNGTGVWEVENVTSQ